VRWWVALIWAAACGGGTGVDLEIRSEVPIASVEIFIANRNCTELDGHTPCREEIGWLDGQMPMAGTIYEMHNADFDKQRLELRLTPDASEDGSTYTVRLVADGEIGESKFMSIVGLDGAGVARAVAVIDDPIPEHSAQRWVVTLQAADPANAAKRPPIASETERRVAVWGRDGTEEQKAGSRCLVMQQWTGNEWASKFIVPASDHDCDGVEPALECDTQYFHLNQQQPAACVAATPTSGTSGGACTIGISACRDGTGNDPQCLVPAIGNPPTVPVVCVPDRVCEVCEGPYGLVSCVQSLLQDTSGLGHASCRFYGGPGGQACGLGKSGSVAKLALPFLSCGSVELRSGSMPLAPTQSSDIMLGLARFGVKVTNPDMCAIEVNFLNGTVALGTSQWIVLALKANVGTMLIPVELVFPPDATDCNAGLSPDTCSVSTLATDHIQSCGR
jgi:hypothetical protein